VFYHICLKNCIYYSITNFYFLFLLPLARSLQVESNLSERETVLEVCETIVKRGGSLAGAGIVGILQKMEEDQRGLIFGNGNRSVVAIDGGLYENYPQYRAYLQDSVKELLGTEKSNNVVIEHTKDGSGIGAALLAASNSIYNQDL